MKTEYNADDENHTEGNEGPNNSAQEYPTPRPGDNVCRTLAMKVCKTCKCEYRVEMFYYNKTKESYFSECKSCNKKRSSKWNKKNKQKYIQNCKKHKVENPELYIAYKQKEYRKNINKYKEYGSKYRQSKHGRAVRLALGRERELRKTNATPPWLTKQHREQMKEIYKNCPEGHHVDHIHPLNHKLLSGLHVPWNLQYLPAVENIKKRNKL